VWESHVTWGTPAQSFVFLGLLVFELEPMYATSDGQTDADDRLMPPPSPPLRGGDIIIILIIIKCIVVNTNKPRLQPVLPPSE